VIKPTDKSKKKKKEGDRGKKEIKNIREHIQFNSIQFQQMKINLFKSSFFNSMKIQIKLSSLLSYWFESVLECSFFLLSSILSLE